MLPDRVSNSGPLQILHCLFILVFQSCETTFRSRENVGCASGSFGGCYSRSWRVWKISDYFWLHCSRHEMCRLLHYGCYGVRSCSSGLVVYG